MLSKPVREAGMEDTKFIVFAPKELITELLTGSFLATVEADVTKNVAKWGKKYFDIT